MARNKFVQKRSRERVQQIMLAAAEEIARVSKIEDLTASSVSRRAGIPVTSIYRYFAGRSEIIAALVDNETGKLDASIRASLDALDSYSVDSVLRAVMVDQLEYFRSNRAAIMIWFGSRGEAQIRERVDARYAYISEWMTEGFEATGWMRKDSPEWGAEGIIWICDRGFEYILKRERSIAEQDLILDELLDMVVDKVTKYAVDGAPTEIDHAAFAANFPAFEQEPLDTAFAVRSQD